MDKARAAIEAMREPTDAMVKVGTNARWRSAVRNPDNTREIWNAMIDAALKNQPIDNPPQKAPNQVGP